MISARAFNAEWKIAKKPASHTTTEMVESFINRSSILVTSKEDIFDKELCRSGAAYYRFVLMP